MSSSLDANILVRPHFRRFFFIVGSNLILDPEVGNPNITFRISLRVGKLGDYFVAHVGVVVKVPGCQLSQACDRGSSLANRRCFFFLSLPFFLKKSKKTCHFPFSPSPLPLQCCQIDDLPAPQSNRSRGKESRSRNVFGESNQAIRLHHTMLL